MHTEESRDIAPGADPVRDVHTDTVSESSPLLINTDAQELVNKNSKSALICCAVAVGCIVMTVGAVIGSVVGRSKKHHHAVSGCDQSSFISNLGIENNSNYTWSLTKSSGSNACCAQNAKPADCYGSLSELAEQWVGIINSGGWYDLEYDVRDSNNNYIGHFGVSLTSQSVTISNQEGVTATIGAYQNGKPQQITVTPNNVPPEPCQIIYNATDPKTGLKVGVNFSGPEWGGVPVWPTCQDQNNAAQFGFNTVRLPFKLEYGSSNGQTIDPQSAYVTQYVALANQLLKQGFEVIVEPHNYMQFNGHNMTPQQCTSLIGQSFVSLFKGMNVVLEAMNEPPGGFDTTTLLDCYLGIISSARAQGFKGTIVIEGSSWGTPSALTNSDGTPSDLFIGLSQFFNGTYGDVQLGIHTYFNGASGGGDGLSECVPADQVLSINRIPQLTALAAQYGVKIRVTEIGVINSPNCQQVLENAFAHFGNNTSVYVNADWWAGTPSNPAQWGPNGYPLLLNPPTDPRYQLMSQYMQSNTTTSVSEHHQVGRNSNEIVRYSNTDFFSSVVIKGLKKGGINAGITTLTSNIVRDTMSYATNNTLVVDVVNGLANAAVMYYLAPEAVLYFVLLQLALLAYRFMSGHQEASLINSVPIVASTALSVINSANPLKSLLESGASFTGGVVTAYASNKGYGLAKAAAKHGLHRLGISQSTNGEKVIEVKQENNAVCHSV